MHSRAIHRQGLSKICCRMLHKLQGHNCCACPSLFPDVVLPAVLQEVLARISAQLKDHVLMLSLQMYGCRVIQKALEVSCKGCLQSLAPSQHRVTPTVLQLCWPAMSPQHLVRTRSHLQRCPAGFSSSCLQRLNCPANEQVQLAAQRMVLMLQAHHAFRIVCLAPSQHLTAPVEHQPLHLPGHQMLHDFDAMRRVENCWA